ncbi:retrovirus-related pol polyprotein from transposon tnt 1-94, partial [Phtheirospermum japonicum]
PNPTFSVWNRKDKLILLWVRSTLTTPLLGHVARATTTSEVWIMLEQMFHSQARASQMHLKQQLQTLSKGSMSILEYVEKKRAISDSLAECLTTVSDEDFVSFLLFGIGSDYGAFNSALIIRVEPITSNELLGLLLREEQRLEDVNKDLSPLSANIAAKSSSTSRSGQAHAPTTDRPKVQCQICSKPFHEAQNCYQRLNMGDFLPTRRHDKQSSKKPAFNSKQAHIVSGNSPSTLTDPWVMDSGATNHVAADLGNMSIQSEYTGTDNLVVGNGQSFPISHIGQSVLTAKHVSNSLPLKNILVVPKISKNLISVSQLCKDNNVILEFHANVCYVKNLQGRIILKGVVENGLYRLPSSPLSSCHRVFVGERASATCWHHRLAHPHESVLRRLLSDYNLPISTNKLLLPCSSCQLGKSHRLHFPNSHVSAEQPFDLVYSDVWGPDPISSMNGNRYFVLFIDDCTKSVWAYFLTHKISSENRVVSSFLQTHGIIHRISCPYTPEQNGASERRNRIIVEKGLALLAHSKLPIDFWEQAFHTTIYLNNRTITPTLKHKSPYICLYHRQPDYQFLKSFGCLCYPYIRPYNCTKMEFRSLPCIFIGNSAKHKGYLCYHIASSRTYISRYVIADESNFMSLDHSSSAQSKTSPFSSLPIQTLQVAASVELPGSSSPPITAPLKSTGLPLSSGEHDLSLASTPVQSSGSPPSNSSSSSSGLTPPSASGLPPIPNSDLSPTAHGLTPPLSSNSSLPPSHTPMVQQSPSKVSSATEPYPNATTYFRPAANSEHTMVTRASTSSLKPKLFSVTKYSLKPDLFESEPNLFYKPQKILIGNMLCN